jgi:Helix-hairpin-helix motif
MKNYIVSFLVCLSITTCAQQLPPPATEQQLENLAANTENDIEDDTYLLLLENYRKHPLNINTATEEDLKHFKILHSLHIQNLIVYRKMFGNLLSIYELQAVPGWDVFTIKKLLPFITVSNNPNINALFKQRIKNGEHSFLIRYARTLEEGEGYKRNSSNAGTYYKGNRDRLLVRYRYNYKNLLQYGVLADKDAGEQFFKGAQYPGFDFYSFHFFMRKAGMIKQFAAGDYTVNMGQGLIQWQGLAFGKGGDVLAVKRQDEIIKPYNSAGEFNFHRGAATTIQYKSWRATAFISFRKLSGNLVTDTINKQDIISAFQTAGYHRTPAEIADRNTILQNAYGGNINYKLKNGHIGLNSISYTFSKSIKKNNELYNTFAINGNTWLNTSIDYSYTYKNIHFFGESAIDKKNAFATLHGGLLSVTTNTDLSFVYRNISKKYRSLYGNAFTENAEPANENGLYAGLSQRVHSNLKVDVYSDIFKFPWLKYRVNAPSSGADEMLQVTYLHSKTTNIYIRFRNEKKQINNTSMLSVIDTLTWTKKQNLRMQAEYKPFENIVLRNRAEMVWFQKGNDIKKTGYLLYADFFYKKPSLKWKINGRIQFFDADDFDARIYTYENDVLYSYSVPFYYGRGMRCYVNMNYDFGKLLPGKYQKKISCEGWIKVALLKNYTNPIGSGLDRITGNHKSDIRCELIINW